jgi:hypothetical protein
MVDTDPSPTEAERLQESLKLEYEWHKHLATLISGIALAIVTVT